LSVTDRRRCCLPDEGWAVKGGLLKRGGLILRQVGTARLLATAALIVIAMLAARFSWRTVFVQDAEGVLYDIRVALTAPTVEQDQRIALVVYDDDTLIQTGRRSPLDRTVLAKALRRIDAMGAKSIAIDILIDMAQPEDAALVDAFKSMETPTFLAYASNDTNGDKITFSQQQFLDAFLKSLAPGNVKPTSIRLEAESDNVLRRWPPSPPGLPPTMAQAMSAPPPAFQNYQGSIAYRRPTDPERGVFATIPIQTFANDDLFAVPEAAAMITEQIKGRHIIIGGHIQDVDLFRTPLGRLDGKQTWGMDGFAHMLAQQLDGNARPRLSTVALWLGALIVVAAGMATALADIRMVLLAPLFVAQFAIIGGLPFWLEQRGTDTFGLPSLGWAIGWALAFTAVSAAARALGAEQRKFAQGALGKYLPRDIAAEILRDPDGLKLHGEKREIFAVFTDLEGFTQLSHAIEPEMVATLLNSYLETLSNVVLEHGGTIDKFVGDAVVAFWGAPIARPDDGERAIKAGWAMYLAGETFRRNVPDGVPAIGVTRVGVHFGEAIVGNFGGEGRIQYTALGDSMNTAARLEAANKQLKTRMLVSAEAAERAGIDWLRPMGRVVLRGRATPVEVFEPAPDMSADERLALAVQTKAAMRGDAEARAGLSKMSEMHPADTALRNLLHRINNPTEGGFYALD